MHHHSLYGTHRLAGLIVHNCESGFYIARRAFCALLELGLVQRNVKVVADLSRRLGIRLNDVTKANGGGVRILEDERVVLANLGEMAGEEAKVHCQRRGIVQGLVLALGKRGWGNVRMLKAKDLLEFSLMMCSCRTGKELSSVPLATGVSGGRAGAEQTIVLECKKFEARLCFGVGIALSQHAQQWQHCQALELPLAAIVTWRMLTSASDRSLEPSILSASAVLLGLAAVNAAVAKDLTDLTGEDRGDIRAGRRIQVPAPYLDTACGKQWSFGLRPAALERW